MHGLCFWPCASSVYSSPQILVYALDLIPSQATLQGGPSTVGLVDEASPAHMVDADLIDLLLVRAVIDALSVLATTSIC